MAETPHSCIDCKKTTSKGRFTRKASGASGAWTKGSLPAWHCFKCLPHGQGRGESVEESLTQTLPKSAAKAGAVTVTAAPTIVSAKAILADRTEGMARVSPLTDSVQHLPVIITTQEEYDTADALLSEANKTLKWWESRMYGTKAQPGPIPSIRSGLDMLYSLFAEVKNPIETLVIKPTKARMEAFVRRQLAEKRHREQEQEAARIEAERKLEEAARKQQSAKTPLQQARAAAVMEEAEQAYISTFQTETIEIGVATNSSARVPKKPTVADLLMFCQGIADGDIPVECIEIKQGYLNKLYRDEPETVTAFPGVTIIDDVQIVGRA